MYDSSKMSSDNITGGITLTIYAQLKYKEIPQHCKMKTLDSLSNIKVFIHIQVLFQTKMYLSKILSDYKSLVFIETFGFNKYLIPYL
jgi:hypothetical protein